MSREKRQRGLAPDDAVAFGPGALATLRQAVEEYGWLLTRGYAAQAALKLVGDRHQLTARQRKAIYRCACTDHARINRSAHQCRPEDLGGRELEIDGFNLLITVETALAGGLVLVGRDTAHRDLASVHGSYRTVVHTREALQRIGDSLGRLQIRSAHWWLDRPVGNSGRLRAQILELAEANGWPWSAELINNPDRELVRTERIVVTSDAWILDGCQTWFDLAGHVVAEAVGTIPQVRLVDLGKSPT
ncbi:MAG: DUF434 domain-containing protein [Nannocystaceae bacterium]